MSKPLPVFCQMPWHIKKAIINSADAETKFSLRRCSEELKMIVEKCPMHYMSLSFDWGSYQHGIRIERRVINGWNEGSAVEFTHEPKGFIRSKEERLRQPSRQKKVNNGNFIDAAIEQFMKLLRCPNTHLKHLKIRILKIDNDKQRQARKDEIYRKLLAALNTLECKIQTESLWMTNQQSQHDTLQILPFLNLATFRGFCLTRERYECSGDPDDVDLSEIAETEHWKQARELTMNNYYMRLPREQIEHFSSAGYDVETFTVNDMEYILSNFLRPNGWKSRWIKCDSNKYKTLVQLISKMENVRKFKANWPPNNSMMFEISREEFNCRVEVSEDHNVITFDDCSMPRRRRLREV